MANWQYGQIAIYFVHLAISIQHDTISQIFFVIASSHISNCKSDFWSTNSVWC